MILKGFDRVVLINNLIRGHFSCNFELIHVLHLSTEFCYDSSRQGMGANVRVLPENPMISGAISPIPECSMVLFIWLLTITFLNE